MFWVDGWNHNHQIAVFSGVTIGPPNNSKNFRIALFGEFYSVHDIDADAANHISAANGEYENRIIFTKTTDLKPA